MSKLVTQAYQFSDSYNEHVRKAAFEGYVEGYHDCMRDSEPDIDEWQRRLSDDYSDLKMKYCRLREKKIYISDVFNKVLRSEITLEEARNTLRVSGIKINYDGK